jgi:hypothetical protein
MRLWSSMVLGGALVLGCGGSDEPIFNQNPDSSAGSGGTSGSSGSGGSSGNGAGGTSGSSATGGSGGDPTDAAADGGSSNSDASEDSPTDGGDAAAGTAGRDGSTEGGGADSGVGIGGPGKVVCGDTACNLPNSQCCLGFPIFGCQPVFPPVCLVSAQINCDDAADCENGRTCCATVAAGNITSANCAASCNNGVVICNDSTRCPGNTTCKPFAGLEHYRTCTP